MNNRENIVFKETYKRPGVNEKMQGRRKTLH